MMLSLGLLLAAATTRPQLVGIGPLLGRIQRYLGISHAAVGLLGTVPVLCMGIFAPLGPRLVRRHGPRPAVTTAIALIAVGGLARAAFTWYPAILASTLVIGAGMGAMGTTLPVIVGGLGAAHRTLATGLYITGINLGAAASSAAAVPLANAWGGWRGALAVLSALSLLLLAGWQWAARRGALADERPHAQAHLSLWRDRRIWVLAALFSAMAFCYYGAISWLADAYVERGWSSTRAGVLVGALNIASLLGALITPWIAGHFASRRTQLVLFGTMYALGFVLLAAGDPVVWIGGILVGIANGVLFVLVMMLPVDLARDRSEVGRIASAMLFCGYTLAAIGPVALGAMRDLTGSFRPVLWVLVGSAAVLVMMIELLFVVVRLQPPSA